MKQVRREHCSQKTSVYYGPVSSALPGGYYCEVSPVKKGMSFTKKPSRDYQSPIGSNKQNRYMYITEIKQVNLSY
ncbi:hypothetical protein Taro_052474 [Colocasia esculenta]|uniref:Uncharacterized protein n=1 Tax=Colocasia esculenta TaxID=4460 RepID=A0A843XIQ2_COLES|nr:hypothetical protein [Colocasia esculenta]